MSEEQMHLNLRFVGEVDGAVFRDIKENLAMVEGEPFELQLGGIGYFPPRRRPEILWVGVDKSAALEQLHHRVESAVVKAGMEPDGRKFAPHVTLARLKTTPEEHVARYITENGLFQVPEFTVDCFHLYSSFLGSENAIHTVEATYQLEPKRNRKL